METRPQRPNKAGRWDTGNLIVLFEKSVLKNKDVIVPCLLSTFQVRVHMYTGAWESLGSNNLWLLMATFVAA